MRLENPSQVSDVIRVEKPKMGYGSGFFRYALEEKRLDSLGIVSNIKALWGALPLDDITRR
jgi:hypothetical protein